MPVPLSALPVALECGITRWPRGRGAEGNNEEKGGLEVRRKVVKVTVALTARARNNIGVQLSVMYVSMNLRVCVCVLNCVERTEDLFLVPRATAFLTDVLPVKCTSQHEHHPNGGP